jgi:hypothetical protein
MSGVTPGRYLGSGRGDGWVTEEATEVLAESGKGQRCRRQAAHRRAPVGHGAPRGHAARGSAHQQRARRDASYLGSRLRRGRRFVRAASDVPGPRAFVVDGYEILSPKSVSVERPGLDGVVIAVARLGSIFGHVRRDDRPVQDARSC